MVIYGENGAGKSSFVDGLEYVIDDGKLRHLRHEYAGRNQEKAIINTHIPDNCASALKLTFVDNTEIDVSIRKNGAHTRIGGEAINITSWDYRTTALRQDEVAEFIRSPKREKYSAILPLLGLESLEFAAENLRLVSRQAEQLAELQQRRGTVAQTALKRAETFGTDGDEDISQSLTALHEKYCPNSAHDQAPFVLCDQVERALKLRMDQHTPEQECFRILRSIAETDIIASLKAVKDANTALAGSVEPLIEEKLRVLNSAHALVTKLGDEGKIACPACGQSVPIDMFRDHVAAEQVRLSDIIAAFDARTNAIAVLVDNLKTLKTNVLNARVAPWREDARTRTSAEAISWISTLNPDLFRQSLDRETIKTIESFVPQAIAAAEESSKNAPPEARDISRDQGIVATIRLIVQAAQYTQEIAEIDALTAFLAALEGAIRTQIRDRSQAVIDEISGSLNTMWDVLHPDEPIDNVKLIVPNNDKAIDVGLRFHGQEQDSPRLTLSEGYRNSLGLCIFLAMASRDGQNDRPLFLDDVVVSLDRNHRGMIAEILEKHFSERQVILLTHDRIWYTELKYQLSGSRWYFKALMPYETPALGIRWSHKTTTFDDARAHLKDRPDSAGNDARKIMDFELALVAEKLEILLPFVRGDKNDHRMANDFLQRLKSDSRKRFRKYVNGAYVSHPDAAGCLEMAHSLLLSWGNRGSHTQDLVRREATKLINVCEEVVELFRCRGCEKPVWFANAGGPKLVQCRCGELQWRYAD